MASPKWRIQVNALIEGYPFDLETLVVIARRRHRAGRLRKRRARVVNGRTNGTCWRRRFL